MNVSMIARRVTLVGALLLGASACGGSGSDNSAPWPSELKDNFITDCVTGAELQGASSEEANDYCSCLLDELEGEFSATEFQEAEQEMLRGEESALDLDSFASRCI